jgi:hypothetical protein
MHDIVQGNDVDLHFFYKNEPKRLKMEEMEPMMVNVMDFLIKTLGITRTNNIHLFKVEMGNGICDEYVDVRKYTRRDLWNSYT